MWRLWYEVSIEKVTIGWACELGRFEKLKQEEVESARPNWLP